MNWPQQHYTIESSTIKHNPLCQNIPKMFNREQLIALSLSSNFRITSAYMNENIHARKISRSRFSLSRITLRIKTEQFSSPCVYTGIPAPSFALATYSKQGGRRKQHELLMTAKGKKQQYQHQQPERQPAGGWEPSLVWEKTHNRDRTVRTLGGKNNNNNTATVQHSSARRRISERKTGRQVEVVIGVLYLHDVVIVIVIGTVIIGGWFSADHELRATTTRCSNLCIWEVE